MSGGLAATTFVDAASPSPEDLFALLESGGQVPVDALQTARELAEREALSTPDAVTRLGLLSERAMAEFLSSALSLDIAGPEDYPDLPLLDRPVNIEFLRARGVLPIARDEAGLALAMVDPSDDFAIASIRLLAGLDVSPVVAVRSELLEALQRQYGEGQSEIDSLSDDAEAGGMHSREEKTGTVIEHGDDAPVVRIVSLLISRAMEARASDIHIEPFEGQLRVRFRIDGILQETESPTVKLAEAVIARIKVMAGLDIAERRLPQDGRIKIVVRGTSLDIRVSSVPVLHGERIVLRLLRQNAGLMDMAALGLAPSVLENLTGMLRLSHGLILVTGPTGSGKTTTLYATLRHLMSQERNLITVEDPVEYQIAGVGQIQVKSDIGLSFAKVLRSVLRQDPDVIMIGEIRDSETAGIAVHAALTGHLVLSTLHTNTAGGAIARLLDMGVEDYLIASCLAGVMAQRLVRTLCPSCRIPLREEDLARLGAVFREKNIQAPRTGEAFQAAGCDACGQTGYAGRSVIAEAMVTTPELRSAIIEQRSTETLQSIAETQGMVVMLEDGLRLVAEGATTWDEILRITGGV